MVLMASLKGAKISKENWSISFIATLLIITSTTGHFFTGLFVNIDYGYDAAKSIAYICFMATAYIVGSKIQHFNFKSLYVAFFLVLAINFLFTAGVSIIPTFLFELYFPEKIMSSSFAQKFSITSVEQLRVWYRPLGTQGSPTYSAFSVNLIYLFFVVAHLKRYLLTENHLIRMLILIAPIILSLLYGSRTEFVASCFISFVAFYHWYSIKPRWFFNIVLGFIMLLFVIILYMLLLNWASDISLLQTAINLDRYLNLIQNPLTGDSEQTIRPLIMFFMALSRFLLSPLIGTGFGQGGSDVLASVWYYHNDIFYVFVTSGIVGFLLYFIIIWRYVTPIHPLLIVPFIVPGLTNSFLLVLPMLIAYFFLLGLFVSATKRTNCVSPLKDSPNGISSYLNPPVQKNLDGGING
jgi:hypothetical protein